MEALCIAIVNQKGGTGKTTTTVNLGCSLAELGKKVLLIDLDPQGSLTYYLGFSNCEYSISDLIFNNMEPGDIMLSTENLWVLPANISLSDVELSLVNHEGRESILKKLIDPIKHQYEYILVDCPPTFSILTINALTFVDKAIIPVQLEVLSLQALELIINTIFSVKETLNTSLSIMGLLPVMVDYRRNITKEVLNHLKNHFGLPIFDIEIGVDVKIIEAPSFAQSVIKYAPFSKSAAAYLELAKKIITM